MKKANLFIAMLIAVFAMSCSNDPNDRPLPQEGEKSVVTLTVYDGSAGTRAAGTDTEPPVGLESAIDATKGLNVVVYDQNGTLAYPTGGDPLNLSLTETGSGTGIYTSDPFIITSGQKYFYIFANDVNNVITTPPPIRSQFISRITSATLDGSDVLNLTTPHFLMGTLWSELETAPANGTAANPKIVPLSIGRLSSKVVLVDVQDLTPTMQGTFSDPDYRLGTIPKNIFLVGNNDEDLPTPPKSGHGIVTSAAHTADRVAPGGDANYYQYSDGWNGMNEPFYTVENSAEPDNYGIQYYGNSTYIQIRTKYTPDDAEVYDPATLIPIGGPFTGPTFYTANLLSNGNRLIFEDDPRTGAGNNPDPDIDQNTVKVYTNGLNYHKFPIYDKQAGLPQVQRNAVLRNHYYEYTVTSISDIGSPDEDIDPVEPIETETTLTIEVKVLPWSKISDNNIPI